MRLEDIFKGELHHAYGIAGTFSAVFPELEKLLGTQLKEKLSGNPDAYVRDAGSLGVDEAREVKEFAGTRSVGGGRKIIILGFLESTRQAQNALLKTLEEPHENVLFFLITPVPDTLLPTLLSRVTRIGGAGVHTYGEEARVFLSTPIQKRIALLKPFLGEEKDRTGALSFVSALEREVRGDTNAPLSPNRASTLQTLERAVSDLRLSGASVKMVLEHLALTL